MYTQCPNCSVAFRITAQVLQQARGRVRCGNCSRPFNALDHLSESPPLPPDGPIPAGLAPPESDGRELMEALGKLAGRDDVRIEDTGIEWRVVDDQAGEPAAMAPADAFGLPDGGSDEQGSLEFDDQRRYDDNTPLPDDFADDQDDTGAWETPRRRASDFEFSVVDEAQTELELSEPDDWADLLHEMQGSEAPGAQDEDPEPVSGREDDGGDGGTGGDSEIESESAPYEYLSVAAADLSDAEIELDTADDEAGIGDDAEVGDEADDQAGVQAHDETEIEDGADDEAEIGGDADLELAGEAEDEAEARADAEIDLEDAADDQAEVDAEIESDDADEDEAEARADADHEIAADEDDEDTGSRFERAIATAEADEDDDGDVAPEQTEGGDTPGDDLAAMTAGLNIDPETLKALEDESLVETIVMEGDRVRGEADDAQAQAQEADPVSSNPGSLLDTYIASRTEEQESPRRGRLAIAAVVLLSLGLAAQYVHNEREYLATFDVFARTVVPVYRALGMPVTPEWNIRGWQFEATSGATGTDSDLLTIDSRISNRSASALPYPLIHVALTDRYEDVIGSRMLEPADYLPEDRDAGQPVPAGGSVTARITIASTSAEATGFKLNVCYPDSGERVRCAIEDFKEP